MLRSAAPAIAAVGEGVLGLSGESPRRSIRIWSVLVAVTAALSGHIDHVRASPQTCGPSLVQVPAPSPDAIYNMLGGVDGTSVNDMWAVGHSNAVFRTLTEHWDGNTWQVVSSPNVGSDDTGLNDVTAIAPNDDWAVGYRTIDFNRFATVAQHWDGSSWNVVTSPNPGRDSNVLTGVAASSASDVWAVGFSLAGARYSTLVQHWDGATWSTIPSPNVGQQSNVLIGVDAASPGDVWAVGYSVVGYKYQTLIERWNGSSWSVQPNPNPAGNHAILTDVNVASNGGWAVGYSGWGSAYRTLAERWDGAAWTIVPTFDPSPDFNIFRNVALDPGGGAWAVGTVTAPPGNFKPLAEHWDGASWSRSPLPVDTAGGLLGVTSGPEAGSVVAVGYLGRAPLVLSTCPSSTTPIASGIPEVGSRFSASRGGSVAPTESASEPLAHIRNRSSEAGPGALDRASVPSVADEAAKAGIAETTETWSASVSDFNNDGWPDFFLGRHGGVGRLYRNDQGHFTEIDGGTFATNDRHGCAWLDWNQDGLPDLACATGGSKGYGVKSNELWVQQPDHTFTNQGAVRGLADPFGRGREITPIDANGDGLMDLFVANLNTRADGLPTPDRLFLNTGKNFRLALFYKVDNEVGSVCAQAGDFNNDGWQDLVTCPRLTGPRLYRNNAGESFTDVSSQMGVSGDTGVKDAILADLNGDGLLDLVEVSPQQLSIRIQQGGKFVLRFTYALHSGRYVASGDVNGDNRLDLYVSESMSTSNSPDVVLLNDGSGTQFTPMAVPDTTIGSGGHVSAIDYNSNGATDFIVTNGLDVPGPVQLISFYPS